MEIFCNIINVFTVTFDHFNVSFLNKSIHFLKKNKSTEKGRTGIITSRNQKYIQDNYNTHNEALLQC